MQTALPSDTFNQVPFFKMHNEVDQTAMAAWATRNLPVRLHAADVAKILNCTPEDVAVLSNAGKLRPLGRPRNNSVKFFSAIELLALSLDREWLDDATKTINQFWRRKNERRKLRGTGAVAQRGEADSSGEIARLAA